MSYGPVAPVNLLALNADAGVRPHLGDEGEGRVLVETAPAQQGIGHHAGAVNPGRAVNQDRAAVIEHLREFGQRRQDRGRGFGLRRLSIFQGQPKPFDAGFCDPLPDEVGMFPGGLQGQHAVAAKQLHGGHRAGAAADPDEVAIEALTNERATFENDVERLLERYIDEAVDSVGLERGLPLFNAVRITWPPVDFELTNPPQLLVRSPRDEIKRDGDTLLKNDLTLRDIERLEAKTTDEDTVSIVVSIGGLAAYPAIVRDDRAFDSVLETASHEWVHHYLAFFPLGEQWGNGGDAETLNETTASIAGREIANLVRLNHPIVLAEGADGRAPARPAPTVDFGAEMRALRLTVDDLLKQGNVTGAERAMERGGESGEGARRARAGGGGRDLGTAPEGVGRGSCGRFLVSSR